MSDDVVHEPEAGEPTPEASPEVASDPVPNILKCRDDAGPVRFFQDDTSTADGNSKPMFKLSADSFVPSVANEVPAAQSNDSPA